MDLFNKNDILKNTISNKLYKIIDVKKRHYVLKQINSKHLKNNNIFVRRKKQVHKKCIVHLPSILKEL